MESALAMIDKERALTPREQYILENIALVDAFIDAFEEGKIVVDNET